MSPATERRLRRWRGLLLVLGVLVAVVGLVVLAGVVAVRVAPSPLPFVLSAVAVLAAVLVAAVVLGRLATRVPDRVVLALDLTGPLADLPPGDPRARLARRERLGLREVVEVLDRAAGDERVAGVWCRIERPAGGLADVQELREAIRGFRARGKFAVAFAESFGAPAGGTAPYYLASACDEVTLQPSGDVVLTGLAREVTFVRGALDRLGVVAQFDQRREYKSAANVLTERQFTPPQREALERVVGETFRQVVAGVARARGLDEQEVRALVDRSPLVGPEALEAGLVDRLCYRDESVAGARARAGGGARLLAVADYRKRTRTQDGVEHGRLLPGAQPRDGDGRATRRRQRPRTVALVHGAGAITTGRSRFNPLTTMSMGADTVCAAIRQAARDEKVEAILFRVDSPGGSYTASDAIWREVARAREAGKPVVVSMGNVAGSGGYFVALPADRIVCHPATVTGSVGVVGGKTVLAGLRERIGLSRDEVHAGAHALMWSNHHEFTPSQWERFQVWLDRGYDDFTGKVAQARGFDDAEVEEVARGRVWTGSDAAERGMVDVLGGYPQALAEVRALLGLPAGAPLRVVTFPRRPSPLRLFLGGDRQPDDEGLPAGTAATELLPSPARLASDLGLAGPDAILLMPEPWGRWPHP